MRDRVVHVDVHHVALCPNAYDDITGAVLQRVGEGLLQNPIHGDSDRAVQAWQGVEGLLHV
ncbi:hypothetical protein D3C73_1598120 [compost metagenome]